MIFQELLKTIQRNISTVRSIIKVNEKLIRAAFGDKSIITQEWGTQADSIIDQLTQDAPEPKDWRIYDHCAVVTRLYAIYERFVEDLIREWIQLLPDLFPVYADLGDRICNTHRIGVARLLLDITKNRFGHLSVEEVIRGLFYGASGTGEKYELLPDAFLLHEQNLRKDTLEKLFADAGILNAWAWVEKHRKIKYFVEEVRGSENTAEGELNELIDYRNDAAYGAFINTILSANELLELCDFVEALCQALAELVTYQIIKQQTSTGQAQEIGQITEWFKKSKAAVAKVEETTLSVGTSVFLMGEAYCQLATIKSIQVDDTDQESVQTSSDMELGLKFDVEARKKIAFICG
ncbi:MAG: MAE_28990/MAE_18760 family HEPN-like nuclease [Coleofasciculus sp. D1-CHI-01]|uniref:MAE_28990/MAE_18760 family HEPN-like nuclease n=1 Tax=Coleofasciculus sp. D1-CHI-01 TaxID=3068482 RepID=UPI0032F9997C